MKIRKAEKVTTEVLILEKIICDVCHKEFSDHHDFNQVIEIYRDNGYSSLFGDGTVLKLDICEECFSKLLKPYYTIEDGE